MVVSDVAEVVETETEGDREPRVDTTPSRFERIKESYKGVTSALDTSEEMSAYEDFASLLGDQKVGGGWCVVGRRCFDSFAVSRAAAIFGFVDHGAIIRRRMRWHTEHRTHA